MAFKRSFFSVCVVYNEGSSWQWLSKNTLADLFFDRVDTPVKKVDLLDKLAFTFNSESLSTALYHCFFELVLLNHLIKVRFLLSLNKRLNLRVVLSEFGLYELQVFVESVLQL